MSYKTLQPGKMLQQRKLAWTDRKKKPKSEMGPGKYGGNSGKVSSYPTNRFHKAPNYRHEAAKMSCCDITSTSLPTRGTIGGVKAFRKNALVQSQFLPPIMAMAAEGSLSRPSKHSSTLRSEMLSRGPMDSDGWRSDGYWKDQEKENQLSARQKDTSLPGSSGDGTNLSRSANLLPGSWEQKTFVVKELGKFVRSPVKQSQTPDIYKSCLLVLSSTRGGGKHSKVQQVPQILRRSVSRSQQCLTLKKTSRRDFSIWRSTEDLDKGINCGEKQSSVDSAFGTDTWSENAEVDVELGMNKVEMDYYTQQRIIKWILQVNAAMFSPHSAESLKSPLTEQDTSIKIVYDGD